MASQLGHNFQALHGADYATTLNFKSQFNTLSIWGPQVDTVIYYYRQECPVLISELCLQLEVSTQGQKGS